MTNVSTAFAKPKLATVPMSGGERWARRAGTAGNARTTESFPVLTRGTDALDAIGVALSADKGETVFDEGEPAEHYFQVLSGTVCVYKLMEDGKRQIVALALPGDFFGFGSGELYDFSAEAITESRIRRFSRARAAALICSDAALGSRLFAIVRDQLVTAQQRLVLLGRKSARARVASFLLMLGARGRNTSSLPDIDLDMSRSDIADYLGLALETVSRVLSQLRENRVIELPSPQHILVHNPAALREIAEGDIALV
jgi:CRP/FNR family transcriptional regulator